MGRLQEEANRFRRAVNARDADAVDALLSRYVGVWESIAPQVKSLARQIEEARKTGKKLSPSWLYRQERYKALIQQIGAEVEAYSQFASERVRQEVATSVRQAERDSLSLLDTATGQEGIVNTWNRLPIEALNELIAVTDSSGPISALFSALPKQAQIAAKSALVNGLAFGLNPRQTARQVQRATGYTAYRAATIARTESLRAYRTAAHETYRANDDIVRGWIWLAALSRRTCPVCLALHGKRFTLKQEFGTHPNCRCTQIPVTEEDYSIPTGEDWFRRQPADTQEHILGKAKYAAYTEGRITLSDMIGEREDSLYGLTRFEKSLKDALGNGKSPARPVKAEKTAQPAGVPVSKSVQLPKKGAEALQEVLQAIDSVHGDGVLPELPADMNTKGSRQGAYWYKGKDAVKLSMNKSGDHLGMTAAHEIGHFIDHKGLSDGTFAIGGKDPLYDEFKDAVKGSESFKELLSLTAKGKVEVTLWDGVTKMNLDVDTRYIMNYLLTWNETWARAYSQYIATRSANPTLLKELDEMRRRDTGQVHYPMQWADKDFEPIAAAIDKIFEAKGWRK